ncbi:MAG: 4a-hydroxytetrahydrobiopterin dehydratase [Pyrinomonadaceae bacterium]
MERKKLTTEETNEKLKDLSGWTIENAHLKKRFDFADFAASLAFVNRAGAIAEKLDHHPDIKFGWGYAEFSTTTHDRNGLTDFDFALAKEIDAIS